jgi:alkylation response protein AidB-like acyl-CoA dehydrogenase
MNPEQVQLRDSLVARLRNRAPDAVWSALCDAGVAGMRVPEALGGLGLPAAELEPVFDALGAVALRAPFLDSAVLAAGLLRDAHAATGEPLLRRIGSGERVAVAGLDPRLAAGVSVGSDGMIGGTVRLVSGAMDAECLILVVHPSIHIVTGQWAARRRAVPLIDGTMAADIDLSGLAAEPLNDRADAVIAAVGDEAAAALCVEAAALMRRLVAETVDYAKQREQFGRAIGSFQVVQHRLVDMHIQARRAAAIARRAIGSLDEAPALRARRVSAAKVTIDAAGRFVAQNAVQLHGGMGMTEELGIGRMFKRLTAIESSFGSADHHLLRFQATGLAA